jgi:hypothetical protein
MDRTVEVVVVTVAMFVFLPASPTRGQDKGDALRKLLKAVEAHKEPKRGSLFAFPQALKILQAEPKKYKGEIRFRGLHTYSTNLDERKLKKQFGKPDETGKEEITVTGEMGVAETVTARMIRYAWLRIYLTPKGEIWYVGRKYK